jgi:hypothetical protein
MYRAALFISGTTAMARQEPILLRPSKVPDVAECFTKYVKPLNVQATEPCQATQQ